MQDLDPSRRHPAAPKAPAQTTHQRPSESNFVHLAAASASAAASAATCRFLGSSRCKKKEAGSTQRPCHFREPWRGVTSTKVSRAQFRFAARSFLPLSFRTPSLHPTWRACPAGCGDAHPSSLACSHAPQPATPSAPLPSRSPPVALLSLCCRRHLLPFCFSMRPAWTRSSSLA